MTYILILFAVALVVAVVVRVRQLGAQARRLRAGLATFDRRLEEERQKAALTPPPRPAPGADDGPR